MSNFKSRHMYMDSWYRSRHITCHHHEPNPPYGHRSLYITQLHTSLWSLHKPPNIIALCSYSLPAIPNANCSLYKEADQCSIIWNHNFVSSSWPTLIKIHKCRFLQVTSRLCVCSLPQIVNNSLVLIYFFQIVLYFFLFFLSFYPGLVQLWLAGLPLRSWWTIGAPSVQGAIPLSIFRFSYQVAVVGFEPPTFWLPGGRFTTRPPCLYTITYMYGLDQTFKQARE